MGSQTKFDSFYAKDKKDGYERWRASKLKCFQTIRAVQQDPGHQSHLNIFHSWGHKMQDDMTDTQ